MGPHYSVHYSVTVLQASLLCNAPAVHSLVIILFGALGTPLTEYYFVVFIGFVIPPLTYLCLSPFGWGMCVWHCFAFHCSPHARCQ